MGNFNLIFWPRSKRNLLHEPCCHSGTAVSVAAEKHVNTTQLTCILTVPNMPVLRANGASLARSYERSPCTCQNCVGAVFHGLDRPRLQKLPQDDHDKRSGSLFHQEEKISHSVRWNKLHIAMPTGGSTHCRRRRNQSRSSPCCRTCNVRGSSLPCLPPRVPITCCAPYLPTSRHRTHAATTTQFGSACVNFWASRMTEIPKSLPPDASRFCRPASADSDSNVRSASLLPHTGLRGPTLCPFCGCVASKLLCAAWPNSKPDQHPLPCACALPLQLVPTSPTQDGRVGPVARSLSMTACGRPNATCLNLASGARAGSITVFACFRACSTRFRDTELLPAFAPPAQALLRSQSGPRAAAWLGTVPSEAGTTIPPDRMLIALRRRLRLPLPVAQGRCGAHGPGCGATVDVYGDHYAACPRTGLLAEPSR